MDESRFFNQPKGLESENNSIEREPSYQRTIQMYGMTPQEMDNALLKLHISRDIEFDHLFKSKEFNLSFYDNTSEVFEDWTIKKQEQLFLVWYSVAELGFNQDATVEEIYAKAKSMGLELCSPATAAFLGLTARENPIPHEYNFTAMEPIPDPGRGEYLFCLSQSQGKDKDDLWLVAFPARLSTTYEPADMFVFCRSQSDANSASDLEQGDKIS